MRIFSAVGLARQGGAGAQVAVADGEEEQAAAGKIALAEVGDIPTQAAGGDLAHGVALAGPLGGGPVRKRRQDKTALGEEILSLAHDEVDLGTVHGDKYSTGECDEYTSEE